MTGTIVDVCAVQFSSDDNMRYVIDI